MRSAERSQTPPRRPNQSCKDVWTPSPPRRPGSLILDLKYHLRLYATSVSQIATEVRPQLANRGLQMMARFDENSVLERHLAKLKYTQTAEILFVGINLSMQTAEPFGADSPSGELLGKFLGEVSVPFMIWNFCPSLTFIRCGRDASYDEVLMENWEMLEDVHALNYDLLRAIVESSPNLQHIWALGRQPLQWLQPSSCSWFQRYNLLGTAHPAHFLRRQPPDTSRFLKCMRMVLSGIECLQTEHAKHEPDEDVGLWFDPLVIDFVCNQWTSVEHRAMRKMLSLHPVLQGAVAGQGAGNKVLFDDPTGVLLSRIHKARRGHFDSIARLLEAGPVQEHTLWKFLSLSPKQQQSVMSRSLAGARSISALLEYRMQRC